MLKVVKNEQPSFVVSVIDLPKESDDKVKTVSFEDAFKEIGETTNSIIK